MGKATAAVARGRWRSNRSTVPPESCTQIVVAAAAGRGAAAKTMSITAKGVRGGKEVVAVAGGAWPQRLWRRLPRWRQETSQ
jgi:hypothetical protein